MDQELKDHLHALTSLLYQQRDRLQELRTHLDERFEQVDRRFGQVDARFEQMDARFEQMDARFEQMDARFEQMDARFEQVDARFGQMDTRFEQMDARFGQMDARFERVDARFGQVEETARHTLVLVEGLRGELRLVAEAVIGIQEKKEADRGEVLRAIDDVKILVKQSYSALDQRVLEIERWRDRQGRDPVEVLRERLGRTS